LLFFKKIGLVASWDKPVPRIREKEKEKVERKPKTPKKKKKSKYKANKVIESKTKDPSTLV